MLAILLLGLRHHYEPINATAPINKEQQWTENITRTTDNLVTKMADSYNNCENNTTTWTTELKENITEFTDTYQSVPNNSPYSNIGNQLTIKTVNIIYTKTGPSSIIPRITKTTRMLKLKPRSNKLKDDLKKIRVLKGIEKGAFENREESLKQN